MNERGEVYEVKSADSNDFKPQKLIDVENGLEKNFSDKALKKMLEIPKEDLSIVLNMSRNERRLYYKNMKKIGKVHGLAKQAVMDCKERYD